MNWYYVENGQQRGPVTDEDLRSLAQSGTIQSDTLVWHEGLANWQPYKTVGVTGATAAAAPIPETGASEAVCTECGRIYKSDEVIRHGNSIVCASCKPMFLQKLKEGVAIQGQMVYAGFWIRLGAKVLDGIIQQILGGIVGFCVGLLLAKSGQLMIQGIAFAAGLMVSAAYSGFFLGKFGATPGKMALRLRVVSPDGGPVSYGKGVGRYFAEILSSIILLIGYIMAAFDPEKRALHDRICNTRVIRVK